MVALVHRILKTEDDRTRVNVAAIVSIVFDQDEAGAFYFPVPAGGVLLRPSETRVHLNCLSVHGLPYNEQSLRAIPILHQADHCGCYCYCCIDTQQI